MRGQERTAAPTPGPFTLIPSRASRPRSGSPATTRCSSQSRSIPHTRRSPFAPTSSMRPSRTPLCGTAITSGPAPLTRRRPAGRRCCAAPPTASRCSQPGRRAVRHAVRTSGSWTGAWQGCSVSADDRPHPAAVGRRDMVRPFYRSGGTGPVESVAKAACLATASADATCGAARRAPGDSTATEHGVLLAEWTVGVADQAVRQAPRTSRVPATAGPPRRRACRVRPDRAG